MNPYDIYLAGLQGAEQGKRRGLASLMGKAFNAPPEQRQQVLGQIAQVDGPSAFDAQKHFDGMDDDARTRLGRDLAVFDTLPDEQKASAYPQIATKAQQLGIPVSPTWNPEFAPHMQKLAQVLGSGAAGMPTGFRELDMKARAAGYVPGTLEYQNALRVALGTEGRASSAGMSTVEIENDQGGKDRYTFDPRKGRYVRFAEGLSGAPQGGPPSAIGQLDPGRDFAQLGQQFGIQPTSTLRTPSHNAEVGGVPNSYHLTGQAADWAVPPAQKEQFIREAQSRGYQAIDEGDHVHIEPPGSPQRRNGATPGVGMLPAARKFAEESGQQAAQLQFLPEQERIKRESAIQEAAGKAEAEARVKREADLATAAQKKYVDATTTLGLLDEAEALLDKSTGSSIGAARDAGAAVFGHSTEGAKAIASLQPIAASLTLAVPRMEGPQSDADRLLYQKAAGDFANPNVPVPTRKAAMVQMRRLATKYRQTGGMSPASTGDTARRRLKYNPATGRIE
jgi:hypothetical protein